MHIRDTHDWKAVIWLAVAAAVIVFGVTAAKAEESLPRPEGFVFGPAQGPALSCNNNHGYTFENFRHMYGEVPVAMALTNAGAVMEMIVDGESGSWSLFVTLPTGETCYVMGGKSFEFLPDPEPAVDERAS